jgi:hypothetical protein
LNVSTAAPVLRPGSRSTDVAIAAALAALTFIIAIYFAPRGFHVGFVDMGHDGYQLRQALDLTHGGVIFKDTFDQYGPLSGYLNVVGFVTLGHRLLSMKYFLCGWYAVTAVLLYAVARQWLGSALAAFAVIVWVGLAPFYNHGIMISPHAYALCFQALATLIALRSENLAPRRFAAIGLLAGLSWAVKQSIGVLYLAAILSYLLTVFVLDRSRWRQVAMAASVMSVMFVAVVGVCLALLWRYGALHDWYLQTLEFPRTFYLTRSVAIDGVERPGALSRLTAPLVQFARLQWGQPLYWIVIRAVVLLAALVQIFRRRATDGLVLIAAITLFLWFGAYPSANFMHQWWTASLAIPAFVFCVRRVVAVKLGSERIVSVATVVLVSVIVSAGLYERLNHTRSRAKTLTTTIDEPAVLRGMRTDVPTRRAFEMLYRTMAGYRAGHPGAKVVSIESSDGWGGGIVESLLFLSFFDDNPHAQPVYWRLPVLSTTVYPRYAETLWREARDEHPLLVEHRIGKFKPFRIQGYTLLAAAQSDYGHWYVYAPRDAVGAEARSTYLAADGAVESGFWEAGTVPKLTRRLNASIEGGWRGSVAPAFRRDATIQVPGDDPFELVDPAFDNGSRPVNIYTWPADLPEATVHGSIEPTPTDVVWRGGRRDIVRELRPGAWTVNGNTSMRYSYLLQWGEQPIEKGRAFIVRGELFEGGLQVGFLQGDQWTSYVTVTNEGPFEAVIEIQKSGRYALVLANCIRSSWLERVWRHPIGAFLGLLRGGVMANRFKVSETGWIEPSAVASHSGQ